MPRGLPPFVHLVLVFASCATMSRSPGPSSATEPAGTATGTTTGTTASGSATNPPAPATGGPAPAGRGSVGTGAAGGPATVGGPDNRGTEADFDAARGLFDRGDQAGARAALESFVARHADHPSRPAAQILLARLALQRGDAASAKRNLDPLAAGTAGAPDAANQNVARYYLGLSELRLGNGARARALLSPFSSPGAAAPIPVAGEDGVVELRGALAEATTGVDPIAALELWDSYFRVAREHEQAWARGRAGEIAARVSAEGAWRAFSAAPASGLARAVLGAKAATYLRSRGDANGAAFIEDQTNDARHAFGFDAATARIGPGDPTRIGLAIPLSGKFQVVGEAALRAAMLAGGAPGNGAGAGTSAGGGTQLLIRDTATDAERAARGVAELTRTEAVIGIVGAAGAKAGNAAVAQATQDGIPMMALQDSAPGALTTAFQVIHAPEARAAALARQALKLGVRRFAIIGPDSAPGKRLREAFRRAVTDGGGAVVAESTYVAGATSFAGAVGALKKQTIEAVFVPDSAERLQLIAPALAVADLWPQPWSKPRGRAATGKDQPRPVLLLSTASELSHKLLDGAGRYVQGALLCPGFFADDSDPRARGFVEAYRGAFGHDPHATEAYAYDAVAALRTITQRGARTRSDVVKALGGSGTTPVMQGLTGDITFGPDHGRTDSPYVYVVDGDDIHALR